MRGVLLLNGEPYAGKIREGYTICCDGAYAWAKGKTKIDENVGDFDSLPYLPEPAPKEIYPSEKDYTDGEIALFRLLDMGVDEIAIYGGTGGREDHFLGNLQLLFAALERGVRAEMIGDRSRLFMARGKTEICGEKGKTVSLLPFGGDALVESSEGMKYPLSHLTLPYGRCCGISNVILSDEARFDCAKGTVLVAVNENPNEKSV